MRITLVDAWIFAGKTDYFEGLSSWWPPEIIYRKVFEECKTGYETVNF